MPQAEGAVVIATQPSDLSGLEPFKQHFFVGGNSIILNILKNNIDELLVTASTDNFDATFKRLMSLLQNETASIEIIQAAFDKNRLNISLNIHQIVGHKFPTGFPSRRAWIHLTVTDSSGNIVFESGKPNDDGSITGCNADENSNNYERHYDIITQADQVQIYESVMQDFEGNITYTLLKGADYAKDNRLLPLGFNIENAGEKIAIHGEAASDDNFIAGSDNITYQIDTQGFTGPFNINAELLYQTISYQFIKDVLQDNHDLIILFSDLYEDIDKTPIQIATVSKTVS